MAISSAVWSASKLVAITLSDSDNISGGPTRGVFVGTGGNATVVDSTGAAVLLKNLISGVVYPLQILRVNVTGTTAADLVALF